VHRNGSAGRVRTVSGKRMTRRRAATHSRQLRGRDATRVNSTCSTSSAASARSELPSDCPPKPCLKVVASKEATRLGFSL